MPAKKTAAPKKAAPKKATSSEAEGTRTPLTAAEQDAAEAQKQSELQADREAHNRRVAPGGAELPKPLSGTGRK